MLVYSTTDWHSIKIDLKNKIKLYVQLKSIGQLKEDPENFINDIKRAAWNNTTRHRTVGN